MAKIKNKNQKFPYSNKSNGGQASTGFLHNECCLRKYSVTIESKLIVGCDDTEEVWRFINAGDCT